MRTRIFNSEPDLPGWVQRSIFYCYVYHLPIGPRPTERVSLKCISGDHMHMAQGSPVFGSLMSNGDIYFCLLQSLLPWLSQKGKRGWRLNKENPPLHLTLLISSIVQSWSLDQAWANVIKYLKRKTVIHTWKQIHLNFMNILDFLAVDTMFSALPLPFHHTSSLWGSVLFNWHMGMEKG